MNDDTDDHFKSCNSVSKFAECCAHVLVSGGAPGEKIKLRYVFTVSDGGSVSGKWDRAMSDLEWTTAWCYYERPQYAPTGTCRVRIYNVDTGKLMAEDSIRIVG